MNSTPEGRGPEPCPRSGVTRRGFLVGAGAGLAVGAPLGWLGLQGWQRLAARNTPPPSSSVPQAAAARSRFAMPGLFPGRVVEVRHPDSVNDANEVNPGVVRSMMARGLCELTGAPRNASADAWRTFFERDDIVGIKVNPVGKRQAGQGREVVPCISSPAVLLEIVAGLRSAGVPARNILVFERYANEFRAAGYERVMGERALDGVRWFASSSGYDNTQLELTGQTRHRDRDPHVVGYDRDVFVSMGFCAREHDDPRDDRRFRSHLSVIITRMVNKVITIPCLKDHRSAGVTLALKNLSHGLNNNVARSHISGVYTPAGARSGPNQCNTFIPTAVAQRPLIEKATLHIMDGLIGVYEGGPGPWNRSWGTWRHKGLFFATDPVALDMVGWRILDARRLVEGWQPVAQMGLLNRAPQALSPLALNTASALRSAVEHLRAREGRASENYDRRQPEHVLLAGFLGLGEWRPEHIEHRLVEMPA
ncbi:MAG: DUF362 domain-containing protein [Gemmataceae bacterium]|nr:DUF362 domain-containing protein [Gemmataceae bacterium]